MQPIPTLRSVVDKLLAAKATVLRLWMSYEVTMHVLTRHSIESELFIERYGAGVFDYFVYVIRGDREIGDCPVIAELLAYLKDHEISADELFLLCSHFRRAMIDVSYEIGINSKVLFDEISYVFDLNFAGVLERYTDTIYQKEREIERNVKLLEEYRRAIDQSAIVSKTDAQGIITYANDKLSRVCGYSPEELVGSSHSLMRHPDMPNAFFKNLWDTITHNKVFKGTIKNRAKDGGTFYVDTTIVPITDMHGHVNEYMAISYEVTDLVVAKEEAIAAGEAKEYFLSNMSHEIRTPLNAILGFVTLLKDEAKSTKDKRYLDIIHNSGENLLSIINDILDFSKLRSGEFTVEHKTFNMHRAISHTLELFVPSVNQHQLTLTSFIDPRIPYELISDPLRIQQVVSNLLSNAIKFTPPFGEITVEASYADNRITVSVADTGIGIAKKDQAHIFDPFSQASRDGAKTYGGTGLGLSISAQLVRHMGGEMRLESQPGIGSTFTFTLPVRIASESRPAPFAVDRVQNLRLALFSHGNEADVMSASLRRYLDSFGIELVTVDNLGASYDLLFFSAQSVADAMRRTIAADPRPAIVLMDALDEVYDRIEGVFPLVMPLYCAKLQEVMERALAGQQKAQMVPQVSQRKQLRGKVLVAEDNEANQELIATLLENLGVEYVLVANGAEALVRMKSQRYDAVLMDEQMPIMDGLSATKKMRQHEQKTKRRHLPIIAITANVIAGRSRRAEYDGFLGKPIGMDALQEMLERFLEVTDATMAPIDTESVDVPSGAVDEAKVCDVLQISHEQFLKLLRLYKEKTAVTFCALQRAIETRHLDEVARLAHAIKGSSGNFRLEALTELAEMMEHRARANEAADYATMFAQMHRLFDDATNAI